MVAYAGLNPRQHQSGTSVDRATRISKIGNAVLRAALYMPALSAMRYNPAIVALVTRLKSRGRLKPKQIVVAAMRKLLVLCFGVFRAFKTPAIPKLGQIASQVVGCVPPTPVRAALFRKSVDGRGR